MSGACSGAPSLSERAAALERALDVAAGRFDGTPAAAAVAEACVTLDKVRSRLGHGTRHTVVALAGPTGVGKSSLLNALVGRELATTGVRRPTTAETHAVTWTDSGADDDRLLDWLDVGARDRVDPAEHGDRLEGLVLLDLPDFDSTERGHRAVVDRVVELVDALLWVVDPLKYADESLHAGYLRPLAGHAEVMHFVMNRIDTVPPAEHAAVVDDFRRRLAEDGIGGTRRANRPTVVTTSATTGEGVDELRTVVAGVVAARRATVARLQADLDAAAGRLGAPVAPTGLPAGARRELCRRLARAAGLESATRLAAAQHRRDARRATGWPPLRWAMALRRQPLSRLPEPSASAVAGAEIESALRDVAESAASGTPPPWPTVLRRAASDTTDEVRTGLDAVTLRAARDSASTPRWWSGVRAAQAALLVVAAVGLAWLAVLAVAGGFLRLSIDPLLVDTPGAEWIPLPTTMLVGGAVAGLVVAWAARLPAAVGARRRAGRTRRALMSGVDEVAESTVVAGIDRALDDLRAVQRDLRTATGNSGPDR